MEERFELAKNRIAEIVSERNVADPFTDYFSRTAAFIVMVMGLCDADMESLDIKALEELNHRLYEDILPGSYDKSFANPGYAVSVLGEDFGRYLSFLYSQLRGLIPFMFEYRGGDVRRLEDITILLEIFLEVYGEFTSAVSEGGKDSLPAVSEVHNSLYFFLSDYADLTLKEKVHEQLDPGLDFATRIIMDSDLSDLRYLYRFGEYITENEIKTAEHLNAMPIEQIQAMADTYTEGYRIGFVMTGKDLSIKKTVNIRYSLGFERVVRAAVQNFRRLGLSPVIYRYAVHAVTGKTSGRIGYLGAIPNRQYDYDHREDMALFLDKALRDRKLDILKLSYEQYKDLASVFAGPAVMEVFGRRPFSPAECISAPAFSDRQQKLEVEYAARAGEIVNSYIKGEERSFTIIAYPVPEIGNDYEAIFDETVKLNTLDYKTYQGIQQRIIDVLDMGCAVYIKGKNGNATDLKVALRKLEKPTEQTQFENCVADVNIPVGEVFTSPVLEGTEGILNVGEVYLNGLKYENLKFVFKDGYVTEYSCSGFEDDGCKYIKDNVLYHHDTLPIGEFAIGTNTTAYAMAVKYKIFDRLPILIAEKTGPHFALGDTCYSHAEDVKVYNPDGKEIISRDNSRSLLRKSDDPESAYFGCHTDVTIPYDELDYIKVVSGDEGTEDIFIIKDGKFVVPGTELLNEPLQ